MPDPQAGEPDVGLRTLTRGRTSTGMGFDYITNVPLLLSCCGFFLVFGCRISCLVGSSLFVDGCSAVSCDFGVFVRGGELKSFYSAILSLSFCHLLA